ncbi:RNA polymerase sigma-70 factor [Aneurinibacillus uraniidurans]|uniref:RNA polymerase sigma-70 factor n=1 Tax=Aneurinibacillus uraniidurans TaxID=2966586 RepID=UPI002349ACCE|nr:RNA polymerase sigma-70 factor [Aneurinibacillus sp. B1]WCN39739.1 RNA polymerase sigma-70 factor [Aneurinibacillus sp. B1]
MTELYEKYKALLFTLAYQLTGSVADAEDVVQDVFMKVYKLHLDHLEEPKAYLCKMVTNRCFDLLKSARRRREQYVGPWLPEPIATPDGDGFESVVRSDLLSYAMLVLLERLSPAERTIFVLREALCFDYPVIAEFVNKSEVNCRKLMSRARGKMGFSEEELIRAEAAGEEWVQKFIAALTQNNINSVLSLLAEDVVLVSDGGGKASAAVHPIETSERVAHFLFGLIQKVSYYEEGIQIELAQLNGQTGLVIRAAGVIQTVVLIHVENDAIASLYFVRNPDKLQRI